MVAGEELRIGRWLQCALQPEDQEIQEIAAGDLARESSGSQWIGELVREMWGSSVGERGSLREE